MFVISVSFCIGLQNFVEIKPLSAELTSYPFFKMVAGNHIGFDLVNDRPLMKCNNCWSKLVPKIGLCLM